jgi:hypothetical protein
MDFSPGMTTPLPLRPDQFFTLCSELATRLQPSHPVEHPLERPIDSGQPVHTVKLIAGLCAASYIELCSSLASQCSPTTRTAPLDERMQPHRSELAARFAKRTDLLSRSQAPVPVPSLGSLTSQPWKLSGDGTPSRGRESHKRTRPQRMALGALRGTEVNERDDVMDANAQQPADNDATPPHLTLLRSSSCSPPRNKRASNYVDIRPLGQADPNQSGWSLASRPVVHGV